MEQIKIHKKLIIPRDTAWERISWKRYSPIWLNRFLEGIYNLIIWTPTIFKDKNWDDFYIFEILKFKLIQQRKKLVKDNRHGGTNQINRDITICLNLIERIQSDYYSTEYQDYFEEELVFSESDKPGFSKMDIKTISENYEPFRKKYIHAISNVVNGAYHGKFPYKDKDVAFYTSQYNQERAHKLLFKILEQKIKGWWD